MASPARLNSNFVGVTIDSTDRLICSCELPMALRPSKDGRPIFFRCQKAYQEDQCENKIWVNEEAQVKQRVPRAVPRTPTGPKQRDIASYFPVTPSTNSDNRRSAKTGAESGGKPKGRRADGYVSTGLERPSTPTPLALTPSKKTETEIPLLATPQTRDRNSVRSKRSYTSGPNYVIDDSPCSKKHRRNAESKENNDPFAIVDSMHGLKGRTIGVTRDVDSGDVMHLNGKTIRITDGVRTFLSQLNKALSPSDGNKL